MPVSKKRTALEEAEWEDEGHDGSLERELMLQCKSFSHPQKYIANNLALAMETLRIYRPRIALHGPAGMGQNYIGTATLHHLEGYHVQNLDLGTLLSDSTRVCLHVANAEFVLTISPFAMLDERGRNSPTFRRSKAASTVDYLHSITPGLVLGYIGDVS